MREKGEVLSLVDIDTSARRTDAQPRVTHSLGVIAPLHPNRRHDYAANEKRPVRRGALDSGLLAVRRRVSLGSTYPL
jgi:hypothetical protein